MKRDQLHISLLIFLLFLQLFSACKSTKSTKTTPSVDTEKPRLIFLVYEMSKKSEGRREVQLLSKKVTEGSMKKRTSEFSGTEKGILRCRLLNTKAEAVETLFLADPLVKEVEYVNNDGQMTRKIVEQEKARFSIRLPLAAAVKQVVLEQMNGEEAEARILISTKVD